MPKLPVSQIQVLSKLENFQERHLNMSPKQLAGINANGRSDLFSLGVMLFQLLTGTEPKAISSESG
jgi:hypothetical protein